MNKKAFSLIELMIGMAVVAVLISLGTYSILTVQQASRDASRTAIGGDITDKINDYRRENLKYPAKSEVIFNLNNITIGGQNVITLKSYLKAKSNTTNNGTKYFYDSVSGGFSLCILLESKSVKSLGTRECPPASSW